MSDSVVAIERIANLIYLIRGEKVMLDSDLAELYQVDTKVFNQAFKRNIERFPDDFAFQLSKDEFENLRSQFVTSRWGGRRYPPYAFTEQGVAMLSGVLRSAQAVEINIAIIRTFIRLRNLLSSNEKLAQKVQEHDEQIAILYKHIQKLLEPPEMPKRNSIGFKVEKNKK